MAQETNAQPPAPDTTDTLELVGRLSDPDQSVAFHAYYVLRNRCYDVMDPGKKPARAALSATLAGELTATVEVPPPKNKPDQKSTSKIKHDVVIRKKLLQLLTFVAGDADVPAVVSVLKDLDLRELARGVLEAIPGRAATTALIHALDGCGPEFRIGVVNALGRRDTSDAQAALRGLLNDDDLDVRLAAIEALANYPDPANAAMMSDVPAAGHAMARGRILKARIRLAEKLADAGNKAAAKRIYQSIPRDAAAQRKAAAMAMKKL